MIRPCRNPGNQGRTTNLAKLIALYRHPKDKAAFDAYYAGTHAPLAKTIPGLTHYEVSDGIVGGPAGPSEYHLVALLSFDTVADIQAGLASPEGQATAADLENFADGGAELLIFDTKAL